MGPTDDPRRLLGHYQEMLGAVREVAERLRARIEELRARYPELSDTPAPPPDEGDERRTPPLVEDGSAGQGFTT